MTLYYVAHANYAEPARVAYVSGPFSSYREALDAKHNSNLISDNLAVVEQVIEVNE